MRPNPTFSPLNSKSRKEILDLAAKYNWSPATTVEKIKYGVNTLQNHYLKEAIISFFH